MKVKTVYKFYAEWCQPCKYYSPTFDKVAGDMVDSGIEFKSINIDDPENNELVLKHKVRGVPTTSKVYNTGEFKTQVGALNENQLKQFIAS